ncbi:MAG: phosphopentomutase [Planctomycetota bacterium]
MTSSSNAHGPRVFCIVLDSLGVGALPDAGDFGDEGTHTLDHLLAAAHPVRLVNLEALGLGRVEGVHGLESAAHPRGSFGRLAEASPGKDTSTGHWELMQCPLDERFPTYPDGFPAEILDPIVEWSGVPGVLCNAPYSGTAVIDDYAAEHLATGAPIVYTSADSVLQVAAHAEHFGLERLYRFCEIAREVTRPFGIGRVIARPFVGTQGAYRRTYDRKDYSLEPPHDTTLDRLVAAGHEVVGVGKIEDIFAARGVTRAIHTEGNADGLERTLEVAHELERGFCFVNLVDFDMLFGHRRDPEGYATALQAFDDWLPRLDAALRPGDLVLLTADHGNDPTFAKGTDHTREYVPLVAYGGHVRAGVDLGTRSTFADVGATVAEWLGIEPGEHGTSFAAELRRGA